jgi:hypothetical protein
MYEGRYTQAASVLAAAEGVAARGDSQLSTRHWVAAVQAQTFAVLGDSNACDRALGAAEQVVALNGPVTSSGWLRFDGSRLTEERGTCYLELGRVDMAEKAIGEALSQSLSSRRRGSVLTDMAMLGAQRRDLDQVLQYGGLAVSIAERIHSVGYVGRKLHALQSRLVPFAADRRVAQFVDRVSQLASRT